MSPLLSLKKKLVLDLDFHDSNFCRKIISCNFAFPARFGKKDSKAKVPVMGLADLSLTYHFLIGMDWALISWSIVILMD